MSKANKVARLEGAPVKSKGKVSGPSVGNPSPTHPNVPQESRVEANRPVSAGSTKHRGDRRDTSKAYTNNTRTHANHANPPGKGSKDQNPRGS